jgi:hypothetical protein
MITMKTWITRTALLLCTVFTMGYARAAATFPGENPDPSAHRSELERALDKQLNKHLTFPWLARTDMTGEVTVAFVINTEGRVRVVECASANKALLDYVLRKLDRIDVGDNPEGVWKTTYLHLVFRPEA